MFTYIYTYIYIHMCIYTYIPIYTYTYSYLYVYVYIQMHIMLYTLYYILLYRFVLLISTLFRSEISCLALFRPSALGGSSKWVILSHQASQKPFGNHQNIHHQITKSLPGTTYHI